MSSHSAAVAQKGRSGKSSRWMERGGIAVMEAELKRRLEELDHNCLQSCLRLEQEKLSVIMSLEKANHELGDRWLRKQVRDKTRKLVELRLARQPRVTTPERRQRNDTSFAAVMNKFKDIQDRRQEISRNPFSHYAIVSRMTGRNITDSLSSFRPPPSVAISSASFPSSMGVGRSYPEFSTVRLSDHLSQSTRSLYFREPTIHKLDQLSGQPGKRSEKIERSHKGIDDKSDRVLKVMKSPLRKRDGAKRKSSEKRDFLSETQKLSSDDETNPMEVHATHMHLGTKVTGKLGVDDHSAQLTPNNSDSEDSCAQSITIPVVESSSTDSGPENEDTNQKKGPVNRKDQETMTELSGDNDDLYQTPSRDDTCSEGCETQDSSEEDGKLQKGRSSQKKRQVTASKRASRKLLPPARQPSMIREESFPVASR